MTVTILALSSKAMYKKIDPVVFEHIFNNF